MGRHATVAGRQAASAAARSKAFTKVAREILVAARLGGGDPAFNPRLRVALDKAREVNMPKDNIERSIKKGTGELEGVSYEEITYEAYGPNGLAIMLEVMTDNRNRTNPELRKMMTKYDGSMAEMGAVAWMFSRKGVVDVSMEGTTEDIVTEVGLDSGAEDVLFDGEIGTLYSSQEDFSTMRQKIEGAKLKILKSGLELVPSNTVDLSGEVAEKAGKLLEILEDQDDVQNVYHNGNFV